MHLVDLRSKAVLLLLTAALMWLHLRTRDLPNNTLSWAFSTSLLTATMATIEVFEHRFGFGLPFGTILILPSLIDETIIALDPALAIAMRIVSPCDSRVTKLDDHGQCMLMSAYNCYKHSSERETDAAQWNVMRTCYHTYGLTSGEATSHHKQCHQLDASPLTGAAACLHVKQAVYDFREQCMPQPSFITCPYIYGVLDEFIPMLNELGLSIDVKSALGPDTLRSCPRDLSAVKFS